MAGFLVLKSHIQTRHGQFYNIKISCTIKPYIWLQQDSMATTGLHTGIGQCLMHLNCAYEFWQRISCPMDAAMPEMISRI